MLPLPGIEYCCQRLGVRQGFSPATPVSPTTYNWLVKRFGRKNDDNWNSEFLPVLDEGRTAACWLGGCEWGRRQPRGCTCTPRGTRSGSASPAYWSTVGRTRGGPGDPSAPVGGSLGTAASARGRSVRCSSRQEDLQQPGKTIESGDN